MIKQRNSARNWRLKRYHEERIFFLLMQTFKLYLICAREFRGHYASPGEGHGNHSSILVWRIPWTEEPGGLQSMGSQRVGHDWTTKQQRCTWHGRFLMLSFLNVRILKNECQRQVHENSRRPGKFCYVKFFIFCWSSSLEINMFLPFTKIQHVILVSQI